MTGPALPVPIGFRIDSGDFPVVTYDDVEAALPAFLQSDDPRAVRDALFQSLQVILQTFQARAGYAAALSDVLRATDEELRTIGRERGIFAQPTDTNDTLRARILTAPSIVTPAAIMAAANAIFAPFTSVLPKYYESISDRWYVGGSTPGRAWGAFLYQNRAEATQSPNYPERLFQGDASANGGLFCPQRDPGNARTFKDTFLTVGRYFVLRVPDISPIDTGGTYVSKQPGLVPPPAPGWYVSSSRSAFNSGFLRIAGASSIAVYTQLCNVIDRIKGHSIRWMMVADPSLR